MKIAIHEREGSFSERWIIYCNEKSIPYKIVNVFNTNIIDQISDCNILIWHHTHDIYRDKLLAKQLLFSLQISGKSVFPDFNTSFFFDDKVGQKYLLEANDIPHVPTYIFYTKKNALEWINKAKFPKVFKLRGGAGSSNVKLLKLKKEAVKYAKRAFGKGFQQYNTWEFFIDSCFNYVNGESSIKLVLFRLYKFLTTTLAWQIFPIEKGYFYLQDFIPNNNFDVRVVVIGNKAFAIKRMNRENDFRASGSGKIIYKKDEIDEQCIKISFDANKKIKSQCIAFDFVFDLNNKPLIIEMSFGFTPSAYDKCSGYWDSEMNWFEGRFKPYRWIINNLISSKNA